MQGREGQHRDTWDKQPRTHTHLRAISEDYGLWEEAGAPKGDPDMHRKNRRSPCKKTPSRILNQGPPCCKATACILYHCAAQRLYILNTAYHYVYAPPNRNKAARMNGCP